MFVELKLFLKQFRPFPYADDETTKHRLQKKATILAQGAGRKTSAGAVVSHQIAVRRNTDIQRSAVAGRGSGVRTPSFGQSCPSD